MIVSMIVMLMGCGGFKFEISSSSNKTVIKVNNAEDTTPSKSYTPSTTTSGTENNSNNNETIKYLYPSTFRIAVLVITSERC